MDLHAVDSHDEPMLEIESTHFRRSVQSKPGLENVRRVERERVFDQYAAPRSQGQTLDVAVLAEVGLDAIGSVGRRHVRISHR